MKKMSDKWKKIVSILLVCAMAIQLVQTANAYSGNLSDSGNTAVTAENETDDLTENQDEVSPEEETDTAAEVQEQAADNDVAAVQANAEQITVDTVWDLETDKTVADVVIAKNVTLTIHTNGHTFTASGNISGEGNLVLTGKNAKVQNVSVASLQIQNAEIDAANADTTQGNTNKITATDNFTITNSTIRNAAFVGYDAQVTGDKNLVFAGANQLYDIALVGAEENGAANVCISGSETIGTASNTNFCCDYKLSYQYENQPLTPEESWPVTYRVKYTGAMTADKAQVIGWHNAGTESAAGVYQSGSEITLPSYAVKGYSSVGWTMNGDAKVYTTLSGKLTGDITLTPSMQAASVTLRMDLGYKPDETTNDDYDKLAEVTTKAATWGEQVPLTTPKRFGYQFSGWKVVNSSEESNYTGTYVTNVSDAEVGTDGSYTITLQAQWTAKTFPIRLFITGADISKVKVMDGNIEYRSPSSYAQGHSNITWNDQSSQLEFPDIYYGETLKDYTKRIGIEELPKLLDTSTGNAHQDFTGWDTPGGAKVDATMSYALNSILDHRQAGTTLEAYENLISSTPVFLTSTWGTAEYTLSVTGADGWDILINGTVQTLSSGKLTQKVAAGSKITFRCSSVNSKNFSNWSFNGGFEPVEENYTSGSKYISYTAEMPYQDVDASFHQDLTDSYVDLAMSSIVFEENVKLPSGRTANGFWYSEKMSAASYVAKDGGKITVNAMTPVFQAASDAADHPEEYFYIWDNADALRVTTCNKETQNQLILENAITVYLRDCNMQATETYKNGAAGTYLGNVQLEMLAGGDTGKKVVDRLADTDLKEYGNVVVDTTRNTNYNVNLYMEGDSNVIADITTTGFHEAQAYSGSIAIQGTSGTRKVTLGTVFGDFAVPVTNLDITPYKKGAEGTADFDYLFYTSYTGTVSLNNCVVDAKDRRIFMYARRMNISGTSNIKILELKTYYEGVQFQGTSQTHVYGDIYSSRHPLSMSGSASVVVDGNVLTTAQDNYSSGTINTAGYLVVKGTVFDASSMTIKKGTVICNVLQLGASAEISGNAVVVANMITSNLYPQLRLSANDMRYYPEFTGGDVGVGYLEQAKENEDDYPFRVYSSSVGSVKAYSFKDKAQIYLLGYYRRTGTIYDLQVKATDETNPIHNYIGNCTDADGNLIQKFSVNTSEIKKEIEEDTADTTNTSECIVLGNSTYTAKSTKPRSISISGSEIYAKGNVTFFNDTTVSEGTVSCNGSFGTKADLNITGGTITADTVGNVGALTTELPDRTMHWKKTTISGGTVHAKVIGARDSYGEKGGAQRSLTEITGGTMDNSTSVRSDLYLNYIYDTSVFPADKNAFSDLKTNIRLSAVCSGSAVSGWNAEKIDSITSPVMADGTNGNWVYEALSGTKITGVDAEGKVLPSDGAEERSVIGKDRLCLYAVKDKYTLSQMYGDSYYSISGSNNDNSSLNFNAVSVTDPADLSTISVKQAMVDTGAKLTLQVTDAKYKERTVVWYTDANGQYHNALYGCEWQDNAITFSMPNADCQIYVVDDEHALPLDLSASSLSFTKAGFITEFASANEDGTLQAASDVNVFAYSGNYKIVQSNIGEGDILDAGVLNYPMLKVSDPSKATANRILFASDFDNLTAGSTQKITVSRVFQQCADAEFGTVLQQKGSDGAKVCMELDGNIALFRFEIKEHTALDLKGYTGADQDRIYFNRAEANTPHSYLTIAGNNDGKAGDFTVENLTLNMRNGYSGYLMFAKDGTDYVSGSLTMKNCVLKKSWGDSTGLARNLSSVTIDGCDIDIATNNGYTTALWDGCTNVTIQNQTKLQWKNIGSTNTGGFLVDYGVKDTLTIDNSDVVTTYDPMDSAGTYLVNPVSGSSASEVILTNNATCTADSRVQFNKLQVKNNAALKLKQWSNNHGNGNEETWLLCKDILVDGGSINADYVIVSGFFEHSDYNVNYKTSLDNRIETQQGMVDGSKYGGLKIKSGTVTAAKFVGGDWNAKIEVSGGTLTAPAIGTNGYLYGFPRQLPANRTDYVYRYNILDYSKYTQAAKVIVKDSGTVNITENGYLGGMRCAVDIQGGTVSLADGAVLGMTETQKQTLADHYSAHGDDIQKHTDTNGSVTASGGTICMANETSGTAEISMPYGTAEFSGTVKAKVNNLKSEYGSVTIKDTNAGYDNPYRGTESGIYKSSTVGIYVLGTLSAQNVTISDGAQVYAENAYAEVVSEDGVYKGALSVTEAGLYAGSYGEKGISRENGDKEYNDTAGSEDKTVFGTRMVSVTYVIDPQNVLSDEDAQTVTNENDTNYKVSDSGSVALKDAECAGYYFKGWYAKADCTGNPVTSLDTSNANDVTLYAKWEKATVTFRVVMDDTSSSYYTAGEFSDNDNWQPVSDGSGYQSSKTVTLTYGDKILTASGINLLDYNTNTLGVTELEYASGVTGVANTAISVDSIVARELAEYYKKQVIADPTYVIPLHVKNVQKRVAIVTFTVNKKDGKPADAAFSTGSTEITASVSVDYGMGNVNAFADSSISTGNSAGLIQPKATGYTFIGWNTNANATKDTKDGWVNAATKFDQNTSVYAIWQANTYLVAFDAGEGQWVTTDQTEPVYGAQEVKKLDYYWVYDTPVTEENSFWLKNTGTNQAMSELPYAWKEGYTFNHDSGWTYFYTEGGQKKTGVVESTEELSRLAVQALNTSVGDPNGNPTTVALTLTAEYAPVKVTYQLNGGKWTTENASNEATPEYQDALAGYVKASDSVDNSKIEQTVTSVGLDNTNYYVASTTAAAYKSDKTFAEADYRNTLSRKGYTFYGWYNSLADAQKAANGDNEIVGNSVGTTPRFHDVTLYAAWKANDYTLDLKVKDSDKTYSYTSFAEKADITGIAVTVGKEISSDNWPARSGDSAWYAYNTGITNPKDTEKRNFLGVTFAALDPGTTDTSNTEGHDVYQKYQTEVLRLENGDMLYENKDVDGNTAGSVFYLPEDSDYQGDELLKNYTIPDYPNNSEIEMYAVYRAKSLVFVERYIDPDGVEKEKIVYTAPYETRSDYPKDYEKEDHNKITNQGYTMIGWFVNDKTTAGEKYPETDGEYERKVSEFEAQAVKNGTYDIMVYTVYTPQISRSVSLVAKQDPKSTDHATDTYTLPSSMQQGTFSMTLNQSNADASGKTLQFVSKSEMEAHQYDVSWKDTSGKTHTSDDTVAVEVSVSNGNQTVTKELSEVENGTLSFGDLEATAGSRISLTLYHSRVMTSENSYPFELKANFAKVENGVNTLANQTVTNNVTVQLKTSQYTVNYTVTLPEALNKLVVQDWGGFSNSDAPDSQNTGAEIVKKTVTAGYGSMLNEIPQLEGYTSTGWKNDSSSDDTYGELLVPVKEADQAIVNLNASYDAMTYQISADQDVLAHWKISYTDGAGSNAYTSLTSSGNAKVTAELKYHSDVKFEPVDTENPDPAEFVTLSMMKAVDSVATSTTTKTKLSKYGNVLPDSGYRFTMPASGMEASYVTVEPLYLEDGTISISEQSYTQAKTTGTITETWRGSYEILQNAQDNAEKVTANTLQISGNVSTQKIVLGNLNISSSDSIALQSADTKASLSLKNSNTKLQLKNIFAPEGSEFDLTGDKGSDGSVSGMVEIQPDMTSAAIGGNAGNVNPGSISLKDLNLNMTMEAGSQASGIGGANRLNLTDAANVTGQITLDGCVVTVTEGSVASVYQGAWLGGAGIASVSLQGTTVKRGSDTHMSGPVITEANEVTVKDSKIGTSTSRVYDPVYAVDRLSVENSEIYISLLDNITQKTVSSMIGTAANGTVDVKNATIKTEKSGQMAQTAALYTGKLLIQDAASDITLEGTQVLEAGNGNMTLNGTSYTQAQSFHETDAARKNYLLLGETGNASNETASDLTVAGMVEKGVVAVRKPAKNTANGISLNNFTVKADTNLMLAGDLEVQGTATIQSDDNAKKVTLAVTNVTENGYTMKFSGQSKVYEAATESAYQQIGGTLETTADFGSGMLDIELQNVTADVGNMYAKDLTVSGGSVTANSGSGAVGSKPADNAGATEVSFTNTQITAAEIGALGTYDETFTIVTEANSNLTGALIQDHYRIAYDTAGKNLTTDDLVHTFRSKETQSGSGDGTVVSTDVWPTNGIPGKPSDAESVKFAAWYLNTIVSTEGETAETTIRNAICAEKDSVPAGLSGNTTLSSDTLEKAAAADVSENNDGTKTLTVHAWFTPTAETSIKKGRAFQSWTGNTDYSVSLPENSAWTLQLTSTGTTISGRDYQVAFGTALPEGTRLTLTVPGSGNEAGKYYYYIVPVSGTTSVKFSEFTVMGGTTHFQTETGTENIPDDETFLLAADFSNAKSVTAGKNNVTFKLLPSESTEVSIGTALAYTLTNVTAGSVSASDQNHTVTVTMPVNEERLNGNKVYLKAVISAEDAQSKIPYNVSAKWNEKDGIWISRDTVLFEVADGTENGSLSGTASFAGLKNGTYKITWSLVYGTDASDNISGNRISGNTISTYVENHTES